MKKTKKLLAAVMAALMLCALCACGGGGTTPSQPKEDAPKFQMKKEKGDDGYTCYGLAEKGTFVADVEIPSEYKGKAVQYVGSSAFLDSGIIQVTVPEGVEGIGQAAFSGCTQLSSVRLPQSLGRIEFGAFSGCTALKEIYIPEGVTELETRAFYGCSALKTVVIEGQVDTLGREAFMDCTDLRVIYLPETLTTIHPNALDNCDALEEIHFAGTVEQFLAIDFTWDWMSAENVLLCCADANVLMEDKGDWSYTDRRPYYPTVPTDALSYYVGGESAADRSEASSGEAVPSGGDEPVFVNTSRTTQAIAPYHAIAMEHAGYIYYFDQNADLCRADSDMNSIERLCAKPLRTDEYQDADTINILGVSDTDVMYITGFGRSFAVELATGQTEELTTGRDGEKVRLYGMSGAYIYYTRSAADPNTLYRSGLSDGFAGEELVVSGELGELSEIYVTDTYLVYVLDEGSTQSLYCAPLVDVQLPIWRDSGGGDHPAIHLIGADGVMAAYYKQGHVLDGCKGYTCDLGGGAIWGGDRIPVSNYAYDAETERVYFFNQHLVYAALADFEDFAAYYDPNGYEDTNTTLGWRITCAGDWLFFRRDFRGGGADCCVSRDGITYVGLRGMV